MYYSVLQLLSLHFDVWIAMQLAMGIAMVVGYFGWYLFGRDVISLRWNIAHVFALVVIAHGFHLMHMMVGHAIYHLMPLMGWLLWLIFERSKDTWKSLSVKAAAFGFITANILYSGGFMVGVFTIAVFVVLLPLELILHIHEIRDRSRVLFLRIAACGLSALLMTAGKLYAVFSMMRFFPRNLPFDQLADGSSTLGYIATALWAFPQSEGLFEKYGLPDWGAIHEYSMALSPIVAIGLLCGLWLIVKNRTRVFQYSSIPVFVCSIILILLFVQLIQGHGPLVTPLEELPIFSSLRMNTRFLYPFSIVLSAIALWNVNHITRHSPTYAKASAGRQLSTINYQLATLLFFSLAYTPLLLDVRPPRSLDYTEVQHHLEVNKGFLGLDVNTVIDMRGTGQAEFVPLFAGANHVYCEEPLLWGDTPDREPLVEGDVYLGWNSRLNMYNPACFIFPEANDCEPGDRILVSDKVNLDRFTQGELATWKVPLMQSILHWISLLTFISSLGILGRALWKR